MLDARQLEALVAVAEQGSFAAAAQHLSLTLAAVSLRIRSLEEVMGQRLLVRGKTVHPTAAGRALLAHARQVHLMEADLLQELQQKASAQGEGAWQTLRVAINADSMASWFLPGVAPLLARHRMLLDITLDDQDHTHDALRNGDVLGCVTTLSRAVRGCVSEPLGVMRYRCVGSRDLVASVQGSDGRLSVHRLLTRPAVIFNRKDALQDAFLAQHFELRQPVYPRHFAPAVDGFEMAIELGLGWGMVPEQHLQARQGKAELVELLPGATVDVALYWQHWEREAPSARRLTEAVKASALACLRPA
jgi:LysR family transcriptional regulator (chromosome initiation inhibitor)